MQLRRAERKKAKIRVGLFGPAGSGKTFSALLLAHGLCPDWEKIAVIDTENQSADLYSSMGPYNVITLGAPYKPERYMEAIRMCESSGMQVIIIDSITHEWDGSGGILEDSARMTGSSFNNWDILGKRHKALLDAILTTPAHMIVCGRTKTEYVIEKVPNRRGEMVDSPVKKGTKVITRDGMDYEVTLAFDLDYSHAARATKDRTGLFEDPILISEDTGRKILVWCESSGDSPEILTSTAAKAIAMVKQMDLESEDIMRLFGITTLRGLTEDQYREIYNKLSEMKESENANASRTVG